MHRPSVWAGAISIFMMLTIVGIRIYGDNLYEYPADPDPLTLPKNSLIVCLAGGKHRIETAFSLFADGVGEHLFIVGAGKRATAAALSRIQAAKVAQKISWDRFDKIQVESDSRNTIENAFVVKKFLDQNPNVKNIVLVTSTYHMRRAMFMIAQQISANVNIIPYTPLNAEIAQDNWWQSWLGISVTTEEYFKYLMARFLIPKLGYI